jgi:RHS repeat-associated protein
VRSTNGAAALPGRNDLDRSYEWDALGRLASATTSSGTTALAYDHSRTRVRKTGPAGDSVTYIGDIAEVTMSGMTKHIFAGRIRVATIQPDGRNLFTMTDHLRSSTLITDEAGTVVQRMDYEPYGDLIENARSGNPAGLRHTYTGQEDDSGTGLMYYGARYYDPAVGMFASADTLTRQPDEPQMFLHPDLFVTSRTNPQGFNRYAYCGNNPMVYTDDTGEFFWFAIIAAVVVGALIGGAVAAIQGGSWQDILIGMGIGAAAGLIGGLGAAGASALGAGAALAGAIGGFAGGFTSGVLGGFHAAGWKASGWKQALTMGAIEGAIGFVLGGVGGYLGGKFSGAATTKHASKVMRGTHKTISWNRPINVIREQFSRTWGTLIEESTMAGLELAVTVPTSLTLSPEDFLL